MTRGSSPAAALDAWLWRHNRRPPASATSAQVTVTEGSIRIRRSGPAGASPTLVLLCDPPNMVEHYDQTLRALDACTASIVMELPGFGFSSVRRGRALEFMATVEAVEAALQQLGNGPWVLYGPCICGFVACEIARRGRVPVTGLVLAQVPDVAGMRAWCDRMDPQHRLRRPGLGQWLGRLGATRLTRVWYRFSTAAETDHEPLTATALRLLDAGAGYPLATMLQEKKAEFAGNVSKWQINTEYDVFSPDNYFWEKAGSQFFVRFQCALSPSCSAGGCGRAGCRRKTKRAGPPRVVRRAPLRVRACRRGSRCRSE